MSKNSTSANYTLRIINAKPSSFPMARLAEYLLEFSELLGPENSPVFSKIKRSSVGIVAAVKNQKVNDIQLRILTAKAKPTSRPGKALAAINGLLSEHGYTDAQLIDAQDKVVHAFNVPSKIEELLFPRISMESTVDGMVLGLMGRDSTMHLQLIDHVDRDIRLLVKCEKLARDLLKHFRSGVVRVLVEGIWVRKESGWVPETGNCVVKSFEVLDECPLSQIFDEFASIQGNGWKDVDDPIALLKELRGLH